MFTRNPSISIVLEKNIADILTKLAKQSGSSVSAVAHKLILHSLELYKEE